MPRLALAAPSSCLCVSVSASLFTSTARGHNKLTMSSSAYQIVERAPDHVVISVPGSSLLSGWLLAGLLLIFLAVAFLSTRSIKRFYADEKSEADIARIVRRNYLFAAGIPVGFCIFFWAVSYTSGSIRLNRATNQAAMESKMTAFLPSRTRTVPLSQVQEAILDEKPNSRRIRLLVEHGSDLAYPMWTGRDGQDAAVTVINDFLGRQTKGER